MIWSARKHSPFLLFQLEDKRSRISISVILSVKNHDVISEEAWPTLVGFSRKILDRVSNVVLITMHGLNEGHIATYAIIYICYSVSDKPWCDQRRSIAPSCLYQLWYQLSHISISFILSTTDLDVISEEAWPTICWLQSWNPQPGRSIVISK